MTPHFLTVDDLAADQLTAVLDHADALKAQRGRTAHLAGKSVALLFEKPSTRTRVSFEVGIAELGATPIVLDAGQLQLGRGETVGDTARVLSRYVHALVVRTFAQSRLEALASEGQVPVVNALSDYAHPCQLLADLQTIREHKGRLAGLRLVYLGDGNNVANSLLVAGAMMGMDVVVASPPGYEPIPQVIDRAEAHARSSGGQVTVTTDPESAARGADVLYTDVWASMGQEGEASDRALMFEPYQLGEHAVGLAAAGALIMHCLPAHRGEEITAGVIDGPQSVVWDQAENRLHSQKALLCHLVGEAPA